jgi:hypothetical protein
MHVIIAAVAAAGASAWGWFSMGTV